MGLDELKVTVDFYKVALHVHCFQFHLAFVKGGGPESLKKNSQILDKLNSSFGESNSGRFSKNCHKGGYQRLKMR